MFLFVDVLSKMSDDDIIQADIGQGDLSPTFRSHNLNYIKFRLAFENLHISDTNLDELLMPEDKKFRFQQKRKREAKLNHKRKLTRKRKRTQRKR